MSSISTYHIRAYIAYTMVADPISKGTGAGSENDQRGLQSLLMQIQSYQAILQDISRQVALTEQTTADLLSAEQGIEELPKTKESEALIPLGAGVYVKGALTDKKTVLVAVGGGLYIEKTAAEAKSFLAGKRAVLEANEKKLREQALRINGELEAAASAADSLYAGLQKK